MDSNPTPRQLEFLKFIAGYTMLLRVPPAEADMQKFFQISPPIYPSDDSYFGETGFHLTGPWAGTVHQGPLPARSLAGFRRSSRTATEIKATNPNYSFTNKIPKKQDAALPMGYQWLNGQIP